MNKKALILLPALMVVLASCNSNSASTSESGKSTTSQTSTTSETPTQKSSMQIAYEAAEALENGTDTAEAYTFEGTVVGKTGNSYFVVDEGYGMYVYNDTKIKPSIGDEVKVTATLTKYNGLLETKSKGVTAAEITGQGTVPAATKVTSIDDISALKQNVLVDLEVTMPDVVKEWSKSAAPLNDCVLGSDTVTIKFDKYGYNDTMNDVYKTTGGKKVVIKNAVTSAYSKDGDTTPTQVLFIGTSSIELAA